MVFETLKEFLTPKHFSMFGYTVAVLHLLTGIIFSAVTTVFIARESGDFVCDVRDTPSNKDYVRLQCYEKYKGQYSPFPLFGFALLSFGTVTGVCIAYSFSVKSRIERMEAMKPDPENPRRRPPVTNRHRVFKYYSVHLALRLVLGIVFIVLQAFIYPSGFPSAFDCTDIKARNQTTTPATANSTDDPISCHMSSQNASWAKAVLVINIIFVVLVTLELYHLGKRVIIQKNTAFMQDFNFCKQHLNLFGKPPPPQQACKADSSCLEPLIVNSERKEKTKLTTENVFDVVVYTGRGDKKLEEWIEQHGQHKITDKYMYLSPRDKAVEINKLSELLEGREDTNHKSPQRVLIVGGPGIGKSVLCEKLLQDLTEKKEEQTADNKRFEYFYSFQFRSFNLTSEKVSLKTLLRERVDSDTFQDMLDNPKKVLLVFDGLDEFMHHSDLKAEYKRAQAGSATEKMPFLSLYANLLKDNPNLLPEATILTTCRPSVLQSVNEEWFPRIAEIMGYTGNTVRTYIEKFCKPDSDDISKKMWKLVSANSILLFLCCIPVTCCIICSHLKWLISASQQNGVSLPTRLTQIYEQVLKVCIFTRDHECKGKEFQGTEVFSGSQEETLRKLGSLAKEGIEKGQQWFRATEVDGMENCGLLHRLPDSQISHFEFKENFCFMQLSVQKFLAARELAKKEPSDLSDFITSNASDPKWHLVIQFVAGLLHGQDNEAVNTFANILCESLIAKPPVGSETKLKVLLMMKCLYEYNDETTVKKAADELKNTLKNSEFKNKMDLSQLTLKENYQVTPFDFAVIVYFIKYFKFTLLNLRSNSITNQGVSYLCDALSDGNCKLTKLDLSGNKIDGNGVVNLCKVLQDENCELKALKLNSNNITNKGLKHLHDALTNSKCKLTKLFLCNSKINDQGVSQLCQALKHRDCKLTKLNLSSNKIKAQGVSDLSEALKVENCKLLKLYLSKIEITDQSILQLCGALKVRYCKLTKLDLGFNKISDQWVSHLCDALTDENCKLAELNLNENSITDQGVSHLCDVLKDVNNCPLVNLNLASNNITDHGVSLLCGALKDINCKLTHVKIKINVNVTDEGYKMLDEALQNKKSSCFVM